MILGILMAIVAIYIILALLMYAADPTQDFWWDALKTEICILIAIGAVVLLFFGLDRIFG